MDTFQVLRFHQIYVADLTLRRSHPFNVGFRKVNPNAKGTKVDVIFLHFVCCIWEMMQQEASSFEYSEDLLIFLLDSLYDDRFGTFAFGDNRMRHKMHISTKTTSIFAHMVSKKHSLSFQNPSYVPSKGPLDVGRNPSVSFFASYFMRGHTLSDFHTIQKNLLMSGLQSASLALEGTSYAFLFSSALPKEDLESLALVKNEFLTLPFGITQYKNIRKLDLSSNMLFEV
jgi:hypothetical protein